MRVISLQWGTSLRAASLAVLCSLIFSFLTSGASAQVRSGQPMGSEIPSASAPISGDPVVPVSTGLALRDMPQIPGLEAAPGGSAIPPLHGAATGSLQMPGGGNDSVVQDWGGKNPMPNPLISFEGLGKIPYGSGSNPDTAGDVNSTYYVQAVNTSLGVFRKSDGVMVSGVHFNVLFKNATAPCNTGNSGDVLVAYDPYAQRWVVADFNVPQPYYECVAVSQTADPTGAWNLYTIKISDTYMNVNGKLSVWSEAYTFTFDMFEYPARVFRGVQVWAFNKADMLAGLPARNVSFDLSSNLDYLSLLPANALSQPALGEPQYLASVAAPNQLELWKLSVDFVTPANSTLTGPTLLAVAPFSAAAQVTQPGTTQTLDSWSPRLMMQLQYRSVGGHTSLWVNHTVANQGLAAPRWYEVGDPGGTPFLAQQGTYQPDSKERWMGSLVVDRDGNMALGYSLGGAGLFPSIAYSGRLHGELPGGLTQSETRLVTGTGYQATSDLWGAYSAMSIDPSDECTFWYSNEYYVTSGTDWHTRIGSFRFPTCGQAKGLLSGVVSDAVTSSPLAGVKVVAASSGVTYSTITNASGVYSMTLTSGTYFVTAGPLLPGYQHPTTLSGVVVNAPQTTTLDIPLQPAAHLVESYVNVVDPGAPYGNANGFAEPGEEGISLTVGLANDGLAASGLVNALLNTNEPGVVINNDRAAYSDILIGQVKPNLAPFIVSLRSTVPCGEALNFIQTVTTTQGVSQVPVSLVAGIPHPWVQVYSNTVPSKLDLGGWTTGGVNNTWTIVTETVHSAPYAWASNPPPKYLPLTNASLQSPVLNLTGMHNVQVGAWVSYDLESGVDYGYLEYSLDGGVTWSVDKLAVYTGQKNWYFSLVNAPMLDDQPAVAIRYRVMTSEFYNLSGFFVDDMAMNAEPFTCGFKASVPESPILLEPSNGGFSSKPVKFNWKPGVGGGVPVTYTLRVDGSVVTTTLGTSYTMSLPVGLHTWGVVAANDAGSSLPSVDWSFVVPRLWYLPLMR